MKYRSKVVVVEAIQFTGENFDEVLEWAAPGYGQPSLLWEHPDKAGTIMVDTIRGHTIATVGDWIIRGLDGMYYPCGQDVFATKYEQDSEQFDFGEALRRIRNTLAPVLPVCVARKGWCGKGLFVFIRKAVTDGDPNNGKEDHEAYICMKTVKGTFVPWVASQTDLQAEDWMEVK